MLTVPCAIREISDTAPFGQEGEHLTYILRREDERSIDECRSNSQ
jgi:hypothetical protein